jgi:peptidoglycan/LPS O-acetylase OafA/YrhL
VTSPHASATTRRLDIQGLRGLAVLLVVCFHAGLPLLGGAFVAVDVFFVLSGFFLMRTLMRHLVAGDGIDLADVQARRVWRLLPTMAVVVLATLASVMLLYAPIDRAAAAEHVGPVAFFASNIAFASGGVNYFSPGENPFLHTWTLGVEYQLALAFPLVVVLLAALGKKRAANIASTDDQRVVIVRTVFNGIAVAGAISFALSVWTSGSAPMWAYFGPHTRFWAFCAGGMVALVASEGQSILGDSKWRIGFAQLAGLMAIFVPALLYDRTMPYPGAIALVPVGGALLLLAGGTEASQTLVGRALALRPIAWLGSVSYPWYLWHWPVMVLGGVILPGIGPWGRLACGVAGLGFAVVTQRFIERRVNVPLLPRVMSASPLIWAAGVSGVLVLAGYVAAERSRSYVARSEHRAFAAAREDRMNHECWVRSVDDSPRDGCAFGDVRSAAAIALLGDSHAEHWLGGLEVAGRERGWRIEAHVMGGCPVADFSSFTSGSTARRYDECSRYREATLAGIVAQKPRAVILSSFDYYMDVGDGIRTESRVSEVAWTLGLRRTYSRIAGAGIPVIVIRGTPRVPFDVPSCLSRRAERLPFATDCTYELDRDFITRARRAQDVAALGLDVRFVDMNDQVCSSARCPTMRGGLVMFTDDNHLTASFARLVGSALGERVEGALGGAGRRSALKTGAEALLELGKRVVIEKTVGRVGTGR